MTTGQQPDPPRRPVQVWMAITSSVGETTPLEMMGWRILDPLDPDDEVIDQEAVRAYHATGQRMPYTDEGGGVGEVILTSTLTCPACRHQATETMPTDACQVVYLCTACGARLRPKPGDCCVFCSYGTVPCPPMQTEQDAGAINDEKP